MNRREEFMSLWTEAHLMELPVGWVAEKYGTTHSSATSFASHLRKQGEYLPKLKRGRKPKVEPNFVQKVLSKLKK